MGGVGMGSISITPIGGSSKSVIIGCILPWATVDCDDSAAWEEDDDDDDDVTGIC